jgi:hypothetical protein
MPNHSEQLTTLNLNHFKMVEAMGLNITASLHQGPLECYHLPTKCHETIPRGSKVISGGHTDIQTGDLRGLLFSFFGKQARNK